MTGDARQGPGWLPAHGAVFVLWLTASMAMGGYLTSDRYPGYSLLWTALLLAAALVGLAVLLAVPLVTRTVTPGAGAAFFVLLAGASSFDVGPPLRAASLLDAARVLLLVAGLALVWWNVTSERSSRLGLGPAMAIMCLAWILYGALRTGVFAPQIRRLSALVPLVAGLGILLPGSPRFDPLLSRLRLGTTLAAGALLFVLPLSPPALLPATLAGPVAPAPA